MSANPRIALREAIELLKPPSRLRVSDSASLYLSNPTAGSSAKWDASLTPYMIEPMNRLGDRSVHTVIFAGPAQSGKTYALILGWAAHSVLSDPSDLMIVQMTQSEARNFSRQRVARSIEKSPELDAMLLRGQDNNVFDKRFKNGVFLNLGWPSISQLSSKPLPRVAFTDYDRMPQNIDGEGDPYSLGRARTKSFMSRGKTLVESSPGFEVLDPDYKPVGHEAPPTHGVLGLFNLGDRNRFYWRCPHCEGLFLAEWQNLSWDKELTNHAAAGQTAHMICTHCGKPIGAEYKDRMNQSGVWRSEYEVFGGEPSDSGIASYWLNGVAASMETWARLVQGNMTAMADYERTGSQEKLKAFVNTSLGMAYKVRRKKGDALDSVLLQQRSEEYGAQRKVPPQARFVTTAVDVQKHRFVVQVQAWGAKGETWIVDRFNIVPSDRIGDDGQKIKVSPFTHPEDWSVLDRLLDDEYPVVGCEVKVKSRLVVCDSGGFGESTANAYAYATRLKRLSKVERFALLKGASTRTAQRISAGKPGDDRIKVPLWVINTTMLKDETWAALGREEAGENYIHLPTWLGEWFFKELTAEEKQANGSWIKRRHGDNNEAFDLCGYNRAAYGILGGEKINWESPPTWCATPVGEQAPEAVKSSKDGNGKFNEWLRARGQRVNGE